jgi:phospholipid N-methyltransferase
MAAKKVKRNFLKEFLKDRQMVGAIHPSTRFLGERMLENINFDETKLIVELGPGTGVFTDLIIEKMHADAKLLVFELNDEFYDHLHKRIDDRRVQIIHDSAEYIEKYLSEEEQQKVDAVISSLPLTVFPDSLRKKVVDVAYDCLKENGVYRQFQYSLHARKLLESKYKKVRIGFTVRNFPPAFIYSCYKS